MFVWHVGVALGGSDKLDLAVGPCIIHVLAFAVLAPAVPIISAVLLP
jgi:hypothetical protein